LLEKPSIGRIALADAEAWNQFRHGVQRDEIVLVAYYFMVMLF